MKEINSITLEIIANGINSIAEQMGVILCKTGYSTNIKERKDLSVAVFSAEGKLLSLAQHIPLHFSSLSGAIEVLMKKYKPEDIYEGDIFIANDPYTGGGSHLPDIVILRPVFYHGKLVAFMVNTGHHADRTRRGPTVYDEGLRIPVVKLYEKGKLCRDMMDLIMLNFQMKYERHGDINAQILTNQFGADKLTELIDKIGLDTYEDFCVEWLKYGERKARVAIKELPDGEYEFQDYMDSDGIGHTDLLIKVKIIIKGDQITFDFTGTCPQVTGPYNCVPSALKATIYYSMMAVLDSTIPANSGFFDSINIIAEPGSLVWATEPAPVSDRETTSQRIADVIFGAFSKLDPKMVVAAGNGAQSFFAFGGLDKRFNQRYVYVETVGGGSGARFNKDGLDTVHVHMTNTSNLPVEALEMEYPLLVEQYAMHENSCGAGQYRGGTGIVRTIKITPESGDTTFTASTERVVYKPWGLEGGQPGGNASLKIFRDGKCISDFPKPRGVELQSGDIVELKTAGAGGYGPVEKRPVEQLRKELREGIIDEQWLINAGIDPATIADEPTTALDVTIQAQVLDLIRKLRDETGTAIAFITHDLGVVSEMCDRAIVLYCGEVMEEASIEDLFDNPSHPYTVGLLHALPHPGQREGDLYVIPGTVPPAGHFPSGCVFAPRCEYATEKCMAEKPQLRTIGERHTVRCHRFDEEVKA